MVIDFVENGFGNKYPEEYVLPELKRKDIHLWSFSVSTMAFYGEEKKTILSTREREKADKFYKESDRTRSRLVYVLLREILSLYTGLNPRSLEILVRKTGKPYIQGHEAPSFNLSHSGDRILYAFAKEREVGVDIELMKDNRDIDGLIGASCSPGEIGILNQLDGMQKKKMFYKLWSNKEAYLKGRGTGITIPLKEVDFSRGERIDNWTIIPCSHWESYSASVALAEKDPGITFVTDEGSVSF